MTLKEITEVSVSRSNRWHGEGGIHNWSPLEWAGAMAGEAGEACNAAKKLKRLTDQIATVNEPGRHYADQVQAVEHVTKEVADTILYGLLLVARVGGDIERAIVEVFNAKSEQYGFPERLTEPL